MGSRRGCDPLPCRYPEHRPDAGLADQPPGGDDEEIEGPAPGNIHAPCRKRSRVVPSASPTARPSGPSRAKPTALSGV